MPRYSCDFVQAPLVGDPNAGSCLATGDGTDITALIETVAAEAVGYAVAGRIHGILYFANSTHIAQFTGDSVGAVKVGLLADSANLPSGEPSRVFVDLPRVGGTSENVGVFKDKAEAVAWIRANVGYCDDDGNVNLLTKAG